MKTFLARKTCAGRPSKSAPDKGPPYFPEASEKGPKGVIIRCTKLPKMPKIKSMVGKRLFLLGEGLSSTVLLRDLHEKSDGNDQIPVTLISLGV